jgi:hypothetical protein
MSSARGAASARRKKESPSTSTSGSGSSGTSGQIAEQPGLRECVQQRLVDDVFEAASGRFLI